MDSELSPVETVVLSTVGQQTITYVLILAMTGYPAWLVETAVLSLLKRGRLTRLGGAAAPCLNDNFGPIREWYRCATPLELLAAQAAEGTVEKIKPDGA